ncbi:hypothetical protein ACNHKD_07505 [Methylocystis sp. JAN1]|uniref:hypothetical protein n=1 Tax=Methylocystis sp. JAN1 TaxID=3397211 RepID=UPI003FA33B0B
MGLETLRSFLMRVRPNEDEAAHRSHGRGMFLDPSLLRQPSLLASSFAALFQFALLREAREILEGSCPSVLMRTCGRLRRESSMDKNHLYLVVSTVERLKGSCLLPAIVDTIQLRPRIS